MSDARKVCAGETAHARVPDDAIGLAARVLLDNTDGINADAAYEIARKMLTASQGEQVALWMMGHGYATGHGDTIADMLDELEAQASRGAENDTERLDFR